MPDETKRSNIQIHKPKTSKMNRYHQSLTITCVLFLFWFFKEIDVFPWSWHDRAGSSGTVKDHAAEGLPMGCLRVLHVMSTGPALASVRSSEAGSTMAEHTQCTGQFITVAEHTYNTHTVSVYCVLIIITTHISLLLPYNTRQFIVFIQQHTRQPYDNWCISLLLP